MTHNKRGSKPLLPAGMMQPAFQLPGCLLLVSLVPTEYAAQGLEAPLAMNIMQFHEWSNLNQSCWLIATTYENWRTD